MKIETYTASFFVLTLTTFLTEGCKKESIETLPIPVEIAINHNVGELPLEMDTIKYVNAAGNSFSVNRMLYYVSGFVLTEINDTKHRMDTAFLINAEDHSTMSFVLGTLPQGEYSTISFCIGLIPELNEFGSLANTLENNAMFWPEQMGGGYHFMKLEGHYLNHDQSFSGYAMHLGTNSAQVDITLNSNFIHDSERHTLHLEMNLLEWFQTPTTYDLNDGNYSMGNEGLMTILSKNGSDVFTLE